MEEREKNPENLAQIGHGLLSQSPVVLVKGGAQDGRGQGGGGGRGGGGHLGDGREFLIRFVEGGGEGSREKKFRIGCFWS